jgi:hypothetical protein
MNRESAPHILLPGPVLQRIYNELRRAPKTAEQLRDLVWGQRDISYSAVYVEIHLLKAKLRPYGLTVRCLWRGPYRLEALAC